MLKSIHGRSLVLVYERALGESAKAKSTARIPKWQVQWYTAAVSQINKKTMNKSVCLGTIAASKDNKTGIVAFVMAAATSMCQKAGSDNLKILGVTFEVFWSKPKAIHCTFWLFWALLDIFF